MTTHHHTYFQSPTTQTNHKPWKNSEPPQSQQTNTDHPSSVLLDLIIDMNWPQTIKRAQTDPIDATYLDEGGETPLYIACQSNAPIDVILALLRAYPSAARVPQTKRRDLPLHLACRYRASARILRALLENAHGPGCGEDHLPVSTPDKWMSSAEMAVMPCRWGRTPLTALWEGHNHALLREEEKSEEELWEKVCVILRAARPDIVRSSNKRDYKDTGTGNSTSNGKDNASSPNDNDNDNDDEWLMLHTAASIGLKACPLSIFRLVLQRCQPIEAHLRDLNGYTALHHLIVAPIANRLICDERDHCEVFDGILDMNPSAACLSLGDDGNHHHDDHDGETTSSSIMVVLGEELVMKRRRLPLHSAIAHGRSWNGGVASLLSAYPDAIRIADPVTGLFPFMLAGASSGKSGFATSLDTIFMLLVSQPDVVHHGLGVNVNGNVNVDGDDDGDDWSESNQGEHHERILSTSQTLFIPFDKRDNDNTSSCVLC